MHNRTSAKPGFGMVALLGVMTASGAMSIDMYLPAMPVIGTELSASPAAVQRTLSTLLAGLAAGQIVFGPLSDRIGRRRPILGGMALFVLASVWSALAVDITQLGFARFFQGLGACSALVVGRAVVRDMYDHRETARILSLITLVFGLVPMLAPLAGSWILTVGSWRMIFWVLVVFGVAIWLAVILGLPESRSEATAETARGETVVGAYRILSGNRRLLGYALCNALNGACLFTYIATGPDLLIGLYGVTPQDFGWIFGANAIGMVIGSQVNRRLLLRWPGDWILAISIVMSVLAAGVMLLFAVTGTGGVWGILVPLFGVMSTYGFMGSNSTAGALSVDPQRAGSISGLMGTLGLATGATATLIVGFVHDGTAVPMAASMLAAQALAALALFGLTFRVRTVSRH